MLLDEGVQFFGREMIPSLQENAEDGIALRAAFKPELGKMLMENVLRFSQRVVSRTWPIIYPLFLA